MSTYYNQYVLLGVKVPYFSDDDMDQFEDNGHDPEITEFDGLTTIGDGMSGEYVFIGKVLHKAEMDMPFDEQIPIDAKSFANAAEIADRIKKHFDIGNAQVKIWVVTHWH